MINSYSFKSSGYIARIVTANEGITPGNFYQFAYLSTNVNGDSELSTNLQVPIADVPPRPLPVKLFEHSMTSLTVKWERVADGPGVVGKISGYRLFMDNGAHEDFKMVFDGE